MATITKHQSSQALAIAQIEMEAGDVVTINLSAPIHSRVSWENGGVSWTINSATAFSVKVEHSLMPTGDDERFWTEDFDSPFASGAEGNEHFRVQRVRFTAASGTPTVVVASNARFEVTE